MHKPVLLKEVIKFLEPRPNQNFVDATLGEGGHALEILKLISPQGKVLGLDWDENVVQGLRLETRSISSSRKGAWETEPPQVSHIARRDRSGIEPQSLDPVLGHRLILRQGNFAQIEEIVSGENFKNVSGILFDLGFRTSQLDDGRGFSYLSDEPLDMRYSSANSLTAAEVINTWPEQELERIFKEYGEERQAKKIARVIIESRGQKKITTSRELAEIINRISGSHRIKTLARIFQALRIAVNRELENIDLGLEGAWHILEGGGRLAVISFHSLEDRLVKNFFNQKYKETGAKILTKKPVTPTMEEIQDNIKSRSAKLRVIIKI